MIRKILLMLIILLGLIIRIHSIDQTPPGIYLDEASIGYDAYSLGLNGKDQYGKNLPIFFRSYANYQSPLYVYLSIIPVKLLGLTPIGVRFISIISGMLTIITTYYLLKLFSKSDLPLFGSLIISIAPWAVLFSRSALEANLALSIFSLSILLLFYGIYKKQKFALFLGFITLSITNYAYHSYRLISPAIIIIFSTLFFTKLPASLRKIFIVGIISFIIILIPQLVLINTASSFSRLNSLEYTSENYFRLNGGGLISIPFGRFLFISNVFLEKYFDYLSPKSLFFDSDPTVIRSIPELGAFYQWMIIPFLVGLLTILKKKRNPNLIFFCLIGLISIVPAAVTRDNLYLLRALSYLWIISIIIGLGCKEIFDYIKRLPLKLLMLTLLLFLSMINLYINYFNLLKHESKYEHRTFIYELFQYTKNQKNSHFIVELTEPLAYGTALFVYQYNPTDFQRTLGFDLTKYYDDLSLKTQHEIDNLSIRPINWEIDVHKNIFLVGDERTIPNYKATENGLILVKKFEIGLEIHNIAVYKTNPQFTCHQKKLPECK